MSSHKQTGQTGPSPELVPPGEVLAKKMKEYGVSVERVSTVLELYASQVDSILALRRELTVQDASRLGDALFPDVPWTEIVSTFSTDLAWHWMQRDAIWKTDREKSHRKWLAVGPRSWENICRSAGSASALLDPGTFCRQVFVECGNLRRDALTEGCDSWRPYVVERFLSGDTEVLRAFSLDASAGWTRKLEEITPLPAQFWIDRLGKWMSENEDSEEKMDSRVDDIGKHLHALSSEATRRFNELERMHVSNAERVKQNLDRIDVLEKKFADFRERITRPTHSDVYERLNALEELVKSVIIGRIEIPDLKCQIEELKTTSYQGTGKAFVWNIEGLRYVAVAQSVDHARNVVLNRLAAVMMSANERTRRVDHVLNTGPREISFGHALEV